jgi:Cu2+-containing amine oxidase
MLKKKNFYWYLFPDGGIQLEGEKKKLFFFLEFSSKFSAKLTGVLSCSVNRDGEVPEGYGTPVAPNLYAPIHQVKKNFFFSFLEFFFFSQHFFTVRINPSIDGFQNCIQELHVQKPTEKQFNPFKVL